MNITERQVKNGLKRGKFSEPFLLHRYGLSPYQGCTHGCSYCDGRAEKYYVEGIFDKDIVIRTNLPELLKKERSLLREPAFIGIGSGTTDAYLDAEEQYRITRQLLTLLEDIGYPVLIATKNARLLQDLDLLKKINQKSRVVIAVSLTSVDDKVLSHFEPGASPPSERLWMLEVLKQEGIGAGVLAMPFIPRITDTEESMSALYRRLAGIGVDFAIPGGMTLRPGRQKEHFLEVLNRWDPDSLEPIKQIYRCNWPSGVPDRQYTGHLHKHFLTLWKTYNLPPHIPHGLFKDVINLCDEFYLLLIHMKDLYGYRGVDTCNLEKSIAIYIQWLTEVRKDFSRRRSLPAGYPDLLLKEELRKGLPMLQNPKLADFLQKVAGGAALDYNLLTLID